MSSIEQDLAAYYDQEAPDRALKRLDAQRVAARDEFLARLESGEGSRLLEIGTGAGRDAASFVGHGIETHGVDLSFEQARHAAGHGARQVVGSVRQLPFGAEAFDAVWSMSVLMHVPNVDIEAALGEVRRVLRPGGIAAIGVWGGADTEEPNPADRYRPPRLFSRRSDEVWHHLLQTVGEIELFRTWTAPDGDWYQFAHVRRP